jgi:hypothetical protein
MFKKELNNNKLYVEWSLDGHSGVFTIQNSSELRRYNKKAAVKENFPDISDSYIEIRIGIESERKEKAAAFLAAGGNEELERRLYNATHYEDAD